MPERTKIAEATLRIKGFTTGLLRRIRNPEYKNINNIPGYEKTEEEYLSLKHVLNEANLMIKDLMSYEYGNRFIKLIKNSLQTVSEKTSLNVYKNKDVFEEMSSVARRMSMMHIEPSCKDTAEKFSKAYKDISESKKVLNSKLESIRLKLKEKRLEITEIDKRRRKVKNMRYDLEMLLQDGGYNGEIREAEKKEFSNFSTQTLKMMIQFVEDASVGPILKSISKEYSNHLNETAEILKNVQ